jgi:hypothetical protein
MESRKRLRLERWPLPPYPPYSYPHPGKWSSRSKIYWIWVGLFLLFHGTLTLLAQEVSVTAEIEPNPVGLDDQLTLIVKINSPAGGAETPQIPRIEGLKLVAGPSVSRSFQWINGQASSSQSFSYIFDPEKEGTFRIPALTVTIGGRVYQTKELYVQVVKSTGSGQRASPRKRSPFSVFDDMGLGEDSPLRDRTPRRDEVLTIAEVDKTTAFVGEQIILAYKVLTQVPIVQVELKDSPPLTGFWSEEVNLPKTPEARNRILNGKQYTEYVVKKQVLFPTRSGIIEIPASAFNLLVRTSSGGLFSIPNQEMVSRKTVPISVKVNPLPESGKPADFNGAVGEFRLETALDKNRATVGDAINLNVKLSGSGNFRTITDFPLPNLPGFKVFSSKSQDNVSFRDDLLQGSKTWDYAIVPQAPGKESIPELKFVHFSPGSKRYLETRTAGIVVVVVQGSGESREPALALGVSQQSIVKRGSDINYLKLTSTALKDRSSQLYQSYWLFGVLIFPLFFNAGLLAYNRQRARLRQDLRGFKSRRAGKVAARRLSQAEQCLKRNELGQFHRILLASITEYLSDKFNLPQIEITSQQMRRFMKEHNWEARVVEELVGVLEDCNFAGYAPVQLEKPKLEDLFEKARDVIVHIERIDRVSNNQQVPLVNRR